jgi:hypothetical protein
METLTLDLPADLAAKIAADPKARARAVALLMAAFGEATGSDLSQSPLTPGERFALARKAEWEEREERLQTRAWRRREVRERQ